VCVREGEGERKTPSGEGERKCEFVCDREIERPLTDRSSRSWQVSFRVIPSDANHILLLAHTSLLSYVAGAPLTISASVTDAYGNFLVIQYKSL